MKERFITYQELCKFFTKNHLSKDLLLFEVMGICSIADLLFITEDVKKGNIKIKSLIKKFDKFQKGPVESGQIFIADLTKEKLNEALFEELFGDIDLWSEPANKKLNPKFSITFLVLKYSQNSWWSPEIFKEMKNIYF